MKFFFILLYFLLIILVDFMVDDFWLRVCLKAFLFLPLFVVFSSLSELVRVSVARAEAIETRYMQMTAEFLSGYIRDYFEDDDMLCVVSVGTTTIRCKIGDNDNMVPVNFDKFCDLNQALDQAYEKWCKKRGDF